MGGEVLTIDATHAYVANKTSVWRVALSGGQVETLLTACKGSLGCYAGDNEDGTPPIVIDDVSLYYEAADGTLWKLPKSGGASTAVTTSPFTLGSVDDSYAYGVGKSGTLATIAKVAKGGGTPIVLYTAPGAPNVISTYEYRPIVSGGSVFWVEFVDSNNLTLPDFAVMKMPITGGSPTTLDTRYQLSGQIFDNLTVQGSYVAWFDVWAGGGPVLETVPVAGGPVTSLKFNTTHDDSYFGPVFDGATLYWGVHHWDEFSSWEQELFSAPVGGPVTSFAHAEQFGSKYLTAIAVDAGNVYLLSEDALVRIAK